MCLRRADDCENRLLVESQPVRKPANVVLGDAVAHAHGAGHGCEPGVGVAGLPASRQLGRIALMGVVIEVDHLQPQAVRGEPNKQLRVKPGESLLDAEDPTRRGALD